jgi:hypothetical protein
MSEITLVEDTAPEGAEIHNPYDLQHEVYSFLMEGWNTMKCRDYYGKSCVRNRLRCFVGDGNPSNKEYDTELDALITSLDRQIQRSKRMGPSMVCLLALNMDATKLSGELLHALTKLEPTNIPEAKEIQEIYGKLASNYDSRDTLLHALEALTTGPIGEWQQEIDRLYPAPEEAEKPQDGPSEGEGS